MAQIDIGGQPYDSYITVAEADIYLAADVLRAETWAANSAELKARAVVTATRLLQRLDWTDGAPPVDAAPQPVKDATALMAADIAAKPALGDAADTSSNVKSVGAGSAKVEFFSPKSGGILPPAVMALVGPYLGVGDDDGTYGTAYGSCRASYFDYADWRLMSDYGADWRARDWSL